MKKLLLPVVLVLILVVSAKATNTEVLQKLAAVNQEWLKQTDALKYTDGISANSNFSYHQWISRHLMLVEVTLRTRNTSHLTQEQHTKRFECLDDLHKYWQKGVYPLNDYTCYKTPVFIDRTGTHCAVGYLMQMSGYDDLAREIDRKQKFAYVHQIKVAGVQQWADEHGFTIEELAWIQPGYPCISENCTTDTIAYVSCYGGFDGCLDLPAISGGTPPYTFQFYPGHDTGYSGVFMGGCLGPGKYTWKIVDAASVKRYIFCTVKQPDSLSTQTTVTNPVISCQGSASVAVTGGTGAYQYLWDNGQTAAAATALCPGKHWVRITDDKQCNKTDTIEILATGVEELADSRLTIFPNPVLGFADIRVTDATIEQVRILNVSGQQVDVPVNATRIETALLPAGVYSVNVVTNQGMVSKRFIKL